MSNYFNRVNTDFEIILSKLSQNPNANYLLAKLEAEKYINSFSAKKHLDSSESGELMEICLELIQDWFPDTTIEVGL